MIWSVTKSTKCFKKGAWGALGKLACLRVPMCLFGRTPQVFGTSKSHPAKQFSIHGTELWSRGEKTAIT